LSRLRWIFRAGPIRVIRDPVAENNNSRNELYTEILDDLEDRESWENRQILWNKMRNQGVRRARKPWPGAADAHVPIGDTVINKLKSYYCQWVFGPELLASFYALNDAGDSYTDSVAQWFDYQLRERSNFTKAAICAIDSLLQNGMGFLKPYYDATKERLAFASVHPYFVIVPPNTEGLDTADRCVHVMHMSKNDYLRSGRNRGYNLDDSFVESITGEGKPDQKYAESRYTAEGLSHTRLKNLVILWEVYERQLDGQIRVHTFSPLQPDEPARESFMLPYQHKQIPLVQIPYELVDMSFFSSRGVMELVQMYEASASKMWNEKLDFMSIANRPVLSTQGGSINAQNIRWEPGAVYDSILQLVQQPPPPVDFDQEIQSNRSYAEQRVGIPDFGVGDQAGSEGKNKTATETNVISQVAQQSNDLRARTTKDAIATVFEQAWSLLRQYKKDDLDYFWRKRRITLPDAALDNAYVLHPNGSVDGYSREKEIQKLMQLRQLAQGSPWIKLPEVDRKIIELMDSSWIMEVFEEPPEVMSNQQESQAIENSCMHDGFLPQVEPTDDHVTHLTILFGYLGWTKQHQQMLPPDVLDIFVQHGTLHVTAARADPAYMKQYGPQIGQLAVQLGALQKEQQMAQAQAQQQQAMQQKAQMTMANLRGGLPPGGAPPPMGGGVPGIPAPPPPPAPGVPAGIGPQMPPGGLPTPPNGSTP
jgi:hypothetical protein